MAVVTLNSDSRVPLYNSAPTSVRANRAPTSLYANHTGKIYDAFSDSSNGSQSPTSVLPAEQFVNGSILFPAQSMKSSLSPTSVPPVNQSSNGSLGNKGSQSSSVSSSDMDGSQNRSPPQVQLRDGQQTLDITT